VVVVYLFGISRESVARSDEGFMTFEVQEEEDAMKEGPNARAPPLIGFRLPTSFKKRHDI